MSKITIEELDKSLIDFLESNNGGLSEEQVKTLINTVAIDGAPAALNTLKKLAASLNNESNFNATIRQYIKANFLSIIANSVTDFNIKDPGIFSIFNDSGKGIPNAPYGGNIYGVLLNMPRSNATVQIFINTACKTYVRSGNLEWIEVLTSKSNISAPSSVEVGKDTTSWTGFKDYRKVGDVEYYSMMGTGLSSTSPSLALELKNTKTNTIEARLDLEKTALYSNKAISLGKESNYFSEGFFNGPVRINSKKVSVQTTAPTSPKTGDIWIQI